VFGVVASRVGTTWLIRRNSIPTSTPNDVAAPDVSSKPQTNIELLVSSLFELTSQVDLQVGQHSLRISEITNSLESPGEIGSAVILVAGKMLIDANQKLQSELDDAKQEIERQRELMMECMKESRMDALTGIPNRRALDHELARSMADHRRFGSTFSLLILDIDHFKRVNDRYGHMVGDQLLKSFSRCLTSTFRETDFVARFGGEEFVAILPMTSVEDACQAAERVRNLIATCRHKIGEFELKVTASIGVREFHPEDTDLEMLEKADKALYAAKNGGRNCCFYFDGSDCQRYESIPESVEAQPELQVDSLEDAAVVEDDVTNLAHDILRSPLRTSHAKMAEPVLQ
jgi:diguanylate cyclase